MKTMKTTNRWYSVQYSILCIAVKVKVGAELQDDPVADSNLQTCSLCGTAVADLAAHIVDDHTELQDMER
jgi:hypothetical protein